MLHCLSLHSVMYVCILSSLSQVKLAQNNLLKDKNTLTSVEGELARFRSLLSKLQQQQSQQKPNQQKDNRTTISSVDSPLKKKKSNVVQTTVEPNEPEKFEASSSTDDNAKNTSSSNMVNIPTPANAPTIRPEDITSEFTSSPLSLSKRLNSKVTREAKIKPGQKIANVVKKLSQEHLAHVLPSTAASSTVASSTVASSTAASSNEEVANQIEDKSTRRSLDAVVAKLHIVKKQEFEKQFHVDLGSAKQVRENTKLDSVVEKLVAKQSQSQLLSSGYPVQFESLVSKSAKIDTALDSPVQYMEADVSSTVPDNFDGNKIDIESKSVVTGASKFKGKFQGTLTRNADKPVLVVGVADSKQVKRPDNVRQSVTNTPTKQGVQIKLASMPKGINKAETAYTVTDSGEKRSIHLRSKEPAVTKVGGTVSNLVSLPTKLPSDESFSALMLSPRGKNILAKVNKFIIETFAVKPKDLFTVKPKDLECLPEKDDSKENLNDSMCGSLTDFYAENSQVCVQQDCSIPDVIFVKLFQVLMLISF